MKKRFSLEYSKEFARRWFGSGPLLEVGWGNGRIKGNRSWQR